MLFVQSMLPILSGSNEMDKPGHLLQLKVGWGLE